MSIVHRAISTYIIQRAGFCKKHTKTVVVTLIQRFGNALNLNIYFDMLFFEGALSEDKLGNTKFTRIKAPIGNRGTMMIWSP